jgi:hypothetical protein
VATVRRPGEGKHIHSRDSCPLSVHSHDACPLAWRTPALTKRLKIFCSRKGPEVDSHQSRCKTCVFIYFSRLARKKAPRLGWTGEAKATASMFRCAARVHQLQESGHASAALPEHQRPILRASSVSSCHHSHRQRFHDLFSQRRDGV